MTLLAGFTVLLHRLSGSDDVVVGSPIANRRHSSTEGVIGFFVNTLVLRGRVASEARFDAVLRQVQRTALAAYAHQDVPFEALVSELSPERSLSHSPLFQVMFALQNAPDAAVELGGVAVRALEQETHSAKFDLFLDLSEQQGELVGVWEYSTDLFELATVARMAEHFATLLAGIAAEPDQAIGRLPLLSAAEQARLVGFNATARPYPRDATIGALFSQLAAEHPEAVALVSGDGVARYGARGDEVAGSGARGDEVAGPGARGAGVLRSGARGDDVVRYGTLEARANRLAHYLRDRVGLTPDRVVGLLLERSSDLIIAMLAVLKAGGAYLPLELNAPAERLGFMLADAEVAAVLTTDALAAALPAGVAALPAGSAALSPGSAPVIRLDAEAAAIEACPATPPPEAATAESLAYVMYTSGSTGRPKGVCVPHRAIVRLVLNTDYARFSADQVFLQYAPVSFDAATFEIWGALLNGARLVLMPPRQDSLEALGRTIAEQGVTTLWLTASLFNLMIDEQPAALRGLRQLLVGGEALSVEHIRRARAVLPGCRLINGYGPTECTTFSCCHTITHVGTAASIPIGRPIANTQAYVLDERGDVLPIGVAGELHIGGDGLARGYLGQPALTAERFIAVAGLGRLYRTGDFVRWRDDGTLEFLGRRDDQIKLRGFRIETGEIEAVLSSHPDVAQATVLLREDDPGRKRLVAYIVAAADQTVDAVVLREHIALRLPDYMIPSTFVSLSQLPLTTNGKIDRTRLPVPDMTPVASRHRSRTLPERVLCKLFADLLGQDDVGIDDNFFALGGDSIVSIQLVARARQAGLVISPRDVFQFQTVEALAGVARSTVTTTSAPADIPVGPLAPTPIMHWLLQRGGPLERFAQVMLLQVPAALREHHVLAALQAVIDHHHALRLRLVRGTNDGDWSLDIAAVRAVDAADLTRRVDIDGFDDALRQSTIHEQAEQALGRLSPFVGVMLQAVWFDAGTEHPGRLLLFIHHLAVDGVSWRILLSDLAAAWDAVVAGQVPALPPNGTSLRAWADRLAADATSPSRAAELPFWTTALGAPVRRLTNDASDPERDTVGAARQLTFTLPASITQSVLTRAPAAFHGGVNDVLLTALVLAIVRYRGDDAGNAVLLDLEGHGREEFFDAVDLSRTVGWLTSMFPVRLDLGELDIGDALCGGPALGRALKNIKEQLRAVPQSGLGYGLLRYVNRQTASQLARFAAPEIGFNYLGRFGTSEAKDWAGAPELAGLSASADPAMPLAHALEIDALTLDTAAGPELRATWSWAPALLSEDTVRELAEGWFTMLGALATHAAEPGAGGHTPSDFDLVTLSQTEIERLEREYPNLEDLLPLSPLQQGLLFHASYASQAADVYVVQLAMDLDGALHEPVMKAAVRELVRRHSSLRSCFKEDGFDQAIQVVVSDAQPHWNSVDLASHEESARAERLEQIMAEDRARGFDLAKPPLLRLSLVALGLERHRLVLTAHHVIIDGWSVPVLVQELLALYAQAGPAAGLPRVTPYRDYLAWLARHDGAAATSAWRDALAGLQEGTLIAPATRRQVQVMPAEIHLALSKPLTAALTRLARDHGLTLNTIVQGCWAILLARLTGRNDVTFGITVAGRPPEIAGIERIIGLFINTLPLRVQLPPAQPMLAFLTDVQERQPDATCQHLGLAEIQSMFGPGELFDTLVVFENYPLDQGSIDHYPNGLRLSHVEGRDATHYPLTLTASPGTCLGLRLGYRADLFDREEAGALARRFVRLLEAAAAETDQPIALLNILDAAEQSWFCAWNDTAHAVPHGTVLDLFASEVENNADAIAASCGPENLRYAELDVRANQLARYLRALGVGPESVVGLCEQRSVGMLVGLLGILKAGGAYLPLDPAYPQDRLEYMIRDSRVSVVVDEARLTTVLPDGIAKVVRIDDDWPMIAQREKTAPDHRLHPRNPAYVIYTSGSTGAPKGVVVTHEGLLNYASWAIDQYRLREGSGAPVNTPLAFDATVTSLLLPVLSGRRVVLLPEDRQFEDLIDRDTPPDDYSLIKLTPAHLELINQLTPIRRLQRADALPCHRRRGLAWRRRRRVASRMSENAADQ